jgi:hypothetical protein
MCYALNKSGLKIQFEKSKTSSGEGGDWYYPRLDDLARFLERTLGAPTLLNKNTWQQDAANKQGIIVLMLQFSDASGHATLWDGKSTIDPDHAYWNDPRFRGAKLWVIK